jgi:1,4-alpha-glucan branching enzyme
MDAQALARLAAGRHHDPFQLLGRHPLPGGGVVVRTYMPQALRVELVGLGELERRRESDFFERRLDGEEAAALPIHYALRWTERDGGVYEAVCPYTFLPLSGELDLHLFAEGRHRQAYRFLGAHARTVEGIAGVAFAVWAPGAERVSVMGDFNGWHGLRHTMRNRGASGVWELFVPGLRPGDIYKYELRNRSTGAVLVKSDPYGALMERRPGTASVVAEARHVWEDEAWLERRARWDWQHEPCSVYEVHAGSWRQADGGGFMNYRDLAHALVDHVSDLGFTHVELMPLAEHPLDESWGYQVSGYFAPTSRHGSPDDLRYLVDHCHRHGIGVLLDWVPAHFPKDDFALARFDGTPLYEHADPRRGEHRDWGTLIFDYGRAEVRSFLLSNALYWLEEFHIDGLRVDAVASMLYLDYSRDAGDWLPNAEGGRENLDAVSFLRELNVVAHGQHPGALVIAEESTAWPGVTHPVDAGGLGFSMKWNMGWMNDTLEYFGKDPVYRAHHHSRLTFSRIYASSENFVLPLSHDEVVHGKRTLLSKMPGDAWQQFANLRLLLAYQWLHPGKKLLFMGGEFGQWTEWDCSREIDWALLDFDTHRGVRDLVRDLNGFYTERPALHGLDFVDAGFDWLDCNNSAHSVLAFRRLGGDDELIVLLNFTPVPRPGYRLGVPRAGVYHVVLDSDAPAYGGAGYRAETALEAQPRPWMGQPHSVVVDLPPLAALLIDRGER